MRLHRIDDYRWELPRRRGMEVPGLVYASASMARDLDRDLSLDQVENVAHLPGIVSHSIAMPDVHQGYGFPIGGVAAFDEQRGVISPGGVGYDINCGVRLLTSQLPLDEVRDQLEALALALHKAIPSGVGRAAHHRLGPHDLDQVLRLGARWAVDQGYGPPSDLEYIEEGGHMPGARPEQLSALARARGLDQLGSLGSGNHFCEIGVVAQVYDDEAARAFGLTRGNLTVMLHSGSRGLGYQVCDDSLREMLRASDRYGIALPDRQLCAAPLGSDEAQRYLAAMACAINYAFANRQVMTHAVRQTMATALQRNESELGLRLVYDVCHNIAKFETHVVHGETRRLCVHRKGATRAFPRGHPDVPLPYRHVGQPVLIPGDMGRYSYVCVGQPRAMAETFGSCCHGAGRKMSRRQAKERARGRKIFAELKDRGIYLCSDARSAVLEEVPEAYKDVADVVDVVHGAGLATRVARLEPLCVIKG